MEEACTNGQARMQLTLPGIQRRQVSPAAAPLVDMVVIGNGTIPQWQWVSPVPSPRLEPHIPLCPAPVLAEALPSPAASAALRFIRRNIALLPEQPTVQCSPASSDCSSKRREHERREATMKFICRNASLLPPTPSGYSQRKVEPPQTPSTLLSERTPMITPDTSVCGSPSVSSQSCSFQQAPCCQTSTSQQAGPVSSMMTPTVAVPVHVASGGSFMQVIHTVQMHSAATAALPVVAVRR